MAVRWPAKIAPDADPAHASSTTATTSSPRSTSWWASRRRGSVNGVPQDPIDGVSFAYAFDDPDAPGRLITQYFEIMGSRAIYHDGWMASATGPRLPWVPGLPPGIAEWTPDQRRVASVQPRRGLVAGQRPRRTDAREARADEGDVRDRGGAQQRLPDRRRALDRRLPPGAADLDALPRMELRPRHHADARVLRPGARQPRQPRHDRRQAPRERQRRALRAGQLQRRPHVLPRRRLPLLRVQPVHHPCGPRSAPSSACRPARRRSRSPPSTSRSSPADR